MKRFVIFLAIFLGMSGMAAVSAQDLIILKDGNVIEAKVTEISPSEIRYKRSNHLDGPTIVVPVVNVLSIRYANGKVDVINAAPAGNANTAGTTVTAEAAVLAEAAGLPGVALLGAVGDISSLQDALNMLPAIPVAGKTLKFLFTGETWRAQVNGADTLSGTLTFQAAEGGGVISLKPTHAYLRGRQIPTPAPEIFLEYKAGPPMSLRAMSKSEQAAAGVQSAAGIQTASAIVLSDDDWRINHGPGCTTQVMVNRETIDGQEVDVLAVEVTVVNMGWAGVENHNDAIAKQLRSATGIRFKVLGDGKAWQLIMYMPETASDGGTYRAVINTKKGKVVEIKIPFSKLRQPEWGKRVKFKKDSIDGMGVERGSHQGLGATTIKVFDIEVY
ncbi:MAG: CIA30 family protein [Treponema sp.]|nr:CIA30 family protein [Treponema sp.]